MGYEELERDRAKKEAAYWRDQCRGMLNMACGGNWTSGVMEYPPKEGCTDPLTLVADAFDGVVERYEDTVAMPKGADGLAIGPGDFMLSKLGGDETLCVGIDHVSVYFWRDGRLERDSASNWVRAVKVGDTSSFCGGDAVLSDGTVIHDATVMHCGRVVGFNDDGVAVEVDASEILGKEDSLELVVASLRSLDDFAALTKDACLALADRIERLGGGR